MDRLSEDREVRRPTGPVTWPRQFRLSELFLLIAAAIPLLAAIPHGAGPTLIALLLTGGLGVIVFAAFRRDFKTMAVGILFILVGGMLIPGGIATKYLGRLPASVQVDVTDIDSGAPVAGATVQLEYVELPWPAIVGTTNDDGRLLASMNLRTHRVAGSWMRTLLWARFDNMNLVVTHPRYVTLARPLHGATDPDMVVDGMAKSIHVELHPTSRSVSQQ